MLTYTKASVDDLRELNLLGVLCYSVYAPVLPAEGWQELKQILEREEITRSLIESAKVFVCKDGGQIVGMIYFVPSGTATEIYRADWCQIRMLGVHPEYNGKGIAKQLIEQCIMQARESGEHTIALHTSEFMDAARHLYVQYGFSIQKEISPRFGMRYWLYTLSLD